VIERGKIRGRIHESYIGINNLISNILRFQPHKTLIFLYIFNNILVLQKICRCIFAPFNVPARIPSGRGHGRFIDAVSKQTR